MKRRIAAIALLALLCGFGGAAQAQKTTWQVINEYPATAIAGEADTFFAEAVKSKTDGRLIVQPVPDAKSGLRTKEQLKAVTEGRFAMANSFGGALADESPIFLLSSLPFVTPTAAHARALYEAARPLYEKLFAERKQKLLYVSPWPPSGIWSAIRITSADVLKALKVRTYDKTSTDLFSQIAGSASMISFADLTPKLENGEINAVLSSGDGGTGRQLWKYLPYFSEITYAIPLSFGSVSLEAWSKLDEKTRAAVEEAAKETIEHQWSAMSGRVERNFAVMQQNNVVIDKHPPLDVTLALATAGAKTLIEWQLRAGPDAGQVYDNYYSRLPK